MGEKKKNHIYGVSHFLGVPLKKTLPGPGGKLIRVPLLLLDVSAALTPNNRDDLRTVDAFRPLEPPKAQAAQRDAAERSVGPSYGFAFPRYHKWILKPVTAKQI